MLDMNKLRSEFEATPEIKAHLDHGNVFWKVWRIYDRG